MERGLTEMIRSFGAKTFYLSCLLILCACIVLLQLQSSYSVNLHKQTVSKKIQILNRSTLTVNATTPIVSKSTQNVSRTTLTAIYTSQLYHFKSLDENEEKFNHGSNICVKKNVSLSKTPLPLTGLVSFPGSGNTWTRHLIQQMTGIGTSSVYCDKKLRETGFPFECHHDQWNRTVLIKTHKPGHISLFTKIVLLIRNPYDAFLSYSNFLLSGHTQQPSRDSLKKVIDKYFLKFLMLYSNLIVKTSRDFKGPVYVLQYEKLKSNMEDELTKLSKFLGTRHTYHDILCTVNQQEGNFHRNSTELKHIQLLKFLYDKSQLLKIQDLRKHTEKLLKNSFDLDFDLSGPEYLLLKKNDIHVN